MFNFFRKILSTLTKLSVMAVLLLTTFIFFMLVAVWACLDNRCRGISLDFFLKLSWGTIPTWIICIKSWAANCKKPLVLPKILPRWLRRLVLAFPVQVIFFYLGYFLIKYYMVSFGMYAERLHYFTLTNVSSEKYVSALWRFLQGLGDNRLCELCSYELRGEVTTTFVEYSGRLTGLWVYYNVVVCIWLLTPPKKLKKPRTWAQVFSWRFLFGYILFFVLFFISMWLAPSWFR